MGGQMVAEEWHPSLHDRFLVVAVNNLVPPLGRVKIGFTGIFSGELVEHHL